MKGLHLAVCTSTILLSFAACLAAGPELYYDGRECDGNGPRDYTYILVAGKGELPILDLRVTTDDLDEHHYSDVLKPEGWSFAIETGGPLRSGRAGTPIGEISLGPIRMVSIGQVRWWTDDPKSAVDSFTFGFNHPWCAQDVGWLAQDEKDVFTEADWDAPVGEGAGPVHGPYSIPEPVTLSLLAAGGLALLRRRAR